MGLGFGLVNIDKRERISFSRVKTGTKKRELSGTIVSGSIITFYMIKNIGDRITFVDDHSSQFQLFEKEFTWADFLEFKDVTDGIIEELINNEILKDVGVIWIDKEENLYFRDLRNIWDPNVDNNNN
jgi:hypothetical protein